MAYWELHDLQAGEDAKANNDVAKALGKAVSRLCTCLNRDGLQFIQRLIKDEGDLAKVEKLARQGLGPPTAYLEGCLALCGMTKKISDDMAIPLGASVSDLVDAMPVYAKLTSLNTDFMQIICPENVAKCKQWCQQVDGSLKAFAQTFMQTVSQLGELAAKYQCLVTHRVSREVDPSLASAKLAQCCCLLDTCWVCSRMYVCV